jgi:hypothetical protein
MVKYSKFWYVTQSMRLAASNLTSVVAAISASQTAAARSAFLSAVTVTLQLAIEQLELELDGKIQLKI